MKLGGKVAIVTGSARGIGRAIAKEFISEGASVFLTDMDAATLEATRAELSSTGGEVFAKAGNVTSDEDLKNLFDFVAATKGKLDILVNNAGITRDGLLLRMSNEDFEKVISVNLTAAFKTTKLALRAFGKSGGVIVNVASVIGITGNTGQANYAASKAGLIGLTRSIAREYASRNVRANAVAPGFIDTEMTRVLKEEVREKILQSIPLGKMGSVEDVAKAVLFLASDDSKYVTGQVLVVDGGMVMA